MRLIGAEHRRDSAAVTEQTLRSRRVEQRRVAVRALARIGDSRAVSLLRSALRDEDPEVVAWAAYGLGRACDRDEATTVKRLVVRAATLIDREQDDAPSSTGGSRLDALGAITRALARCGTPTAERTLRAWLSGSTRRSELAARSLGLLASHHKSLEEPSLVALLDAASDRHRPSTHALLAFSRLGTLGPAVRERLLEVASECLHARGLRRALAIRALGRVGPPAAAVLEQVAVDPRANASERADAIRELARLGKPAQKTLLQAFERLVHEAERSHALVGSRAWPPLLAALEALEPPAPTARDAAQSLVALSLDGVTGPERKRRIALRCLGASLVVDGAGHSPLVLGCDPDKGELFRLTELATLDRATLVGDRLRRWQQLAEDPDPRVREAAIKLVASHPELRNAAELLASWLGSDHSGVVATAAQVLAARPDRAGVGTPSASATRDSQPATLRPETPVIHAIGKALSHGWAADAIGTKAALIDAAGSLQLLGLSSRLESYCHGPNPTLREHARRALELLGRQDPECNAHGPTSQAPKELSALVTEPVRLRFETDVGELVLTLDPRFAPVSVTRIIGLVRSGFYDKSVVHRVVPGFIVQFGDRQGDGYGTLDRPPLRDEISPVPFEAYSVGLALSGPDTGSSQLFVTLGTFPHLDGEFPMLGRAELGWERLAEGDVIHRVWVVR